METIKQTLFTVWNFMRWLRLVFGIFFTIQGIQSADSLMVVVGAFFLLTAVTNTVCRDAGRCAAPVQKGANDEPEEITIEVIKN